MADHEYITIGANVQVDREDKDNSDTSENNETLMNLLAQPKYPC